MTIQTEASQRGWDNENPRKTQPIFFKNAFLFKHHLKYTHFFQI